MQEQVTIVSLIINRFLMPTFFTLVGAVVARPVHSWLVGLGLALLPLLAIAQVPTWQEAFSGGTNQPIGSGSSAANAIATDVSGNVYITGTFSGQMNFGSTRISSVGSDDIFVAKWYSAAHAWAWAVTGGGLSNDSGNAVAVDGSGNVLIVGTVATGATSSTNLTSAFAVQFGGTGLNAASAGIRGNYDVFVVKYNAAGVCQWAVAGGGNSDDYGYGVAVDGSGNVLVTGSVYNAATSNINSASDPTYAVQFGGVNLHSITTVPNGDMFAAKYSQNGVYQWAVTGGGTSTDYGSGITVDSSGNVLVVGSVATAATSASNQASSYLVQFGGIGLNSASTRTANNYDVFVVKYSAVGVYQWAQAAGGTGDDEGTGVALDGNGDVLLTGYVTNKAISTTNYTSAYAVQFGGIGLNSANVSIRGNQDVFVAKYSGAGVYRWAVTGGGTNTNVGYAVTADSNSNVFVTGVVYNAASSSTNLASNPVLAVQFGGIGLNSASSIVSTNSDVFVAKYNVNGTYQWAVAAGTSGPDSSNGLAVDGSRNIWVAGDLYPPATFGNIVLSSTTRNFIAFVARLNDFTTPIRPASPSSSAATLFPNPVPVGSSV